MFPMVVVVVGSNFTCSGRGSTNTDPLIADVYAVVTVDPPAPCNMRLLKNSCRPSSA